MNIMIGSQRMGRIARTLSIPAAVILSSVAGCGAPAESDVADGTPDQAAAAPDVAAVEQASALATYTEASFLTTDHVPTTGGDWYSGDGSYKFAWDPASGSPATGASFRTLKLGTGYYRVDIFNRQNTRATVQIGSTGFQSNIRCKSAGWGNTAVSGAFSAYVLCHDSSGNQVDSNFSIYTLAAGMPGLTSTAFAWTNQASATHSPSLAYAANPGAQGITVTYNGTGQYEVYMPGISTSGGQAQVTAYGFGSEFCTLAGWYPVGSGTNVSVRCWNQSGARADSLFTVMFFTGEPGPSTTSAYVWADQQDFYGTSGNYVPNTTYSRNPLSSASIGAHRSDGTIQYTVGFPGFQEKFPKGGMVTAYGDAPTYCHMTQTGYSSYTVFKVPAEALTVQCQSTGGNWKRSKFAATLLLGR